MAVTIQQIAERAGVSRGTGDRALKHRTDQSGGGREDLSSGGRDGICTERTETFQNGQR